MDSNLFPVHFPCAGQYFSTAAESIFFFSSWRLLQSCNFVHRRFGLVHFKLFITGGGEIFWPFSVKEMPNANLNATRWHSVFSLGFREKTKRKFKINFPSKKDSEKSAEGFYIFSDVANGYSMHEFSAAMYFLALFRQRSVLSEMHRGLISIFKFHEKLNFLSHFEYFKCALKTTQVGPLPHFLILQI